LADLAGSLILTSSVSVEEDLGNEENENNCHGQRQNSDQVMSRVALASHHDPWTIPAFSLTIVLFRCEQPALHTLPAKGFITVPGDSIIET
jgi:hypothetical protein